jgi:hypothetical protein
MWGLAALEADHTAAVLERAQVEDPSWPFLFDVIEKTAATPRLAEYSRFFDRAVIAEPKIAPALKVLKPNPVKGKQVLVFDDVFTGGLTLRESRTGCAPPAPSMSTASSSRASRTAELRNQIDEVAVAAGEALDILKQFAPDAL